MKKKILVTGGAGFIGSHLCEKLVEDTHNDVYSLDNYFTGKKENHIDGVTYIYGDCVDIEKYIDFSPHIIFHLGEYSRVEQSFEDIELVWKYNKDGIFSVLEFVRKNNCKLIYAGSSTKFAEKGLGREASPYAWTKASNTELIRNYGRWFNIDYAITYFYNVYGPREISQGKYATLIGLFGDRIKNDLPLSVVKPGTQKRNFTHVKDIVEGLILVAHKGYGDEYGIGSSQSYTVMEIAQMFGGRIELIDERLGNRMNSKVITSKIKELGWKPQYNLKDYIHRTFL